MLDRDGVINRDSPGYIKSPAEWEPVPGSLEAIHQLTAHGFTVVVASNQSGVGRGLFSAATLQAINAQMQARVRAAGGEIAAVFCCPHAPADGCDCRKPRPGLLRQIEAAYGVSLRGQPVIGDSGRDLDAALAVGARAMLVRTGNGERTARSYPELGRVEVFADLAAAAAALTGGEAGA